MTKFKDYDALAAEKEAFGFRVGGRDFEFPPELPARKALDLRRKALEVGEMSGPQAEDFGFQLIEDIIGREDYDYILDHIGIIALGELVEELMRHYGFGSEETEDAGDPKAEEGNLEESPTRTSFNTGAPSTQTSSAFGLIPGGLSTTTPSPGPVSSAG